MRIVADRNMPFAAEAFETLGETVIMDGRRLTAPDVRDAEVLAIRSTTRVNAALLDGSRVRFVGTATIGTDHMDIAYLESRGIGWCFSPGCNANSVSEYIVAALLHLAARHRFPLAGKTMGVIGVGNVGRLVVRKAQALGMKVLMNDPPRKRLALAEGNAGEAACFVELDELLAGSDIVTAHVPMTKDGPDRTFHLAGEAFLAAMRPGAIFINAARGAVVDTPALIRAIRSGRIAHTVLDTWEGEPDYNTELLDLVDIGTPHIAGHSFEGKAVGTEMVYRAACAAVARQPAWTLEGRYPPPPVPLAAAEARGRAIEAVLDDIVRQVYDIAADDARLRGRDATVEKAAHFDGLRKNYPMRREFRFTQAVCGDAGDELRTTLSALGFHLSP
jgi:erythronate-4-phosphate dehydrogenase